jgi:hypothetical protein
MEQQLDPSMDLKEKLKEIMGEKFRREVLFVKKNGEKVKKRIALGSSGDFIEIPKGKRSFGYAIDYQEYVDVIDISKKPEDEKAAWEKQVRKIIDKLGKSGLWPEVKQDAITVLDIGFDKLMKACDQYWVDNEGCDYYRNKSVNAERIRQIDPRLVDANDKGEVWAKTSLLWEPFGHKVIKIKKMNYGSRNEIIFREIADAMKNKQPYRARAYTSYDVSFDYDPSKNRASYAEEFRNCGNGHYYIALDEQYALFMEDD